MKDSSVKGLTLLGKDLKMAKILVLNKHGYSCAEIAAAMGIPESVVRGIVAEAEKQK